MATIRQIIRTTLTGNAALMAQLTGGVLDASVLDQTGEGASQAPRESDGVRLKPHAVIRWKDSVAYGPYKIGAENEEIEIHIYQDVGYDVIESAIIKIRNLLHDKYFNTDDRALAHVSQIFRSGEIPAEELGYAPRRFLRFSIINIVR